MAAPEEFFDAYVAAALWSTNGDDDRPLDADHDASNIATDTLAKMRADCDAFYAANSEHIHCEDAPLSRDFEGSITDQQAALAGHDFWLTRCGHGVGFWDGDWPEPHASALTEAAQSFGNVELYVGDDGLIYA